MKLVFVVLLALFACSYAHLDVEKYLTQFGYYSNNHAYSGENVTSALLAYQKTFDLPQTGKADEETIKLMNTPRCGMRDHMNLGYADTAWRKKYLTYYFHNYTPDLSQSSVRTLTEKAFAVWSAVTPLRFSEQRGGDIVIAFGSRSHSDNRKRCYSPFDGKSGVLAHAFFPPDGRLHFDEDEYYTQGTTSGTNYLWVATHELGHILGLEHDTQNKDAVMYPYYRGYQPNGLRLHYNDKRRIQRLYGSGGGNPPPPPTRAPPPSGCRDTGNDCSRLTQYCRDSRYKQWAQTTCKKTCGYCNGSGGLNCTNKHTNCAQYQQYCNTSNWIDYLNKNCNRTCGCRV